MKKWLFPLNLLLMAALYIGNYFYHTVGGLEIKMLCSSIFTLQGLVNAIFAIRMEKKFQAAPFCLFLGLFLSMAGDYLLGVDFLIGAATFAAGHVCYLISHCLLRPFRKYDLIPCLLLFAGGSAFLLFSPLVSFTDESQKWICLGYALVISGMTGKALGNLMMERSIASALLAFGSMLFFFSDFMLVLDWFTKLGRWTGTLCMAAYYPAQSLLALAIFFIISYQKGGLSHAHHHCSV